VIGKTLGGVANPCSIPKGGFMGGREMSSDGLGQLQIVQGPILAKTIYSTGLYQSPQCHTATSSNPSITQRSMIVPDWLYSLTFDFETLASNGTLLLL